MAFATSPEFAPADLERDLAEVTTPPVAGALARMMVAVVARGTGQRAALDRIEVAGKTGTAELGDTTDTDGEETEADTHAWFVAFAPADRPRLAVAVMLLRQGKGGERAAPIAREGGAPGRAVGSAAPEGGATVASEGGRPEKVLGGWPPVS
jgi:membrane peptidoglycan carboxypeptidase